MSFLLRGCLLLPVAAALALPPPAQAQRVEAVGLGASFNVSQSWVREPLLQLDRYQLLTDQERGRLDDTGSRYSAYVRVGLGRQGFFVQPELAYTSAESSRYYLAYPGDPGPPSAPDYESASIGLFRYNTHRVELAALAGYHLSPRLYVLAGPVLAWQQHETLAGQRPIETVYRSLYQAVERRQLLGHAGVGWQVWHLDLSLRYEHGLTPYSRQLTYNGQTQGFHQRTNQFIFGLGLLLYSRDRSWRN